MNIQIKAPCRDGANDKTHTKIKSHKHCTKTNKATNTYVAAIKHNLGAMQ